MSEIVVINGPPGVGKTTATGVLSDLLPGTVCIRGDDLRGFAPADARKHLGGRSTYRAAAALAGAYLVMGAPRVVFDYVFLNVAHVTTFLDALDVCAEAPVHMFTLWAPLEVVQHRERERPGRARLGVAVEECWREIATNAAGLGKFLDNSAIAANETARSIARAIEIGEARVAGAVRGRPRSCG